MYSSTLKTSFSPSLPLSLSPLASGSLSGVGEDTPDGPAVSGPPSSKKQFYEELVFSWITAHPATRSVVYANAWFFFDLLVLYYTFNKLYMYLYLLQIKSMAQSLQRTGKLDGDRKSRFSQKFLKDTEVLIGMVSSEIAEKHIKVSGCGY